MINAETAVVYRATVTPREGYTRTKRFFKRSSAIRWAASVLITGHCLCDLPTYGDELTGYHGEACRLHDGSEYARTVRRRLETYIRLRIAENAE